MEQKALHSLLKVYGMDELDLEVAQKMNVLLHFDKEQLTQQDKTRILNEVFGTISEEAFAKRIDIMINQINMTEQECKKYENATKQMESVVERLPRFSNYKIPLLKSIKIERRKYGLK